MQLLYLLIEIIVKCVVVFAGLMMVVAYFATTFFPVFVNNLLMAGDDSMSQQPEYKVFIGRVEKR